MSSTTCREVSQEEVLAARVRELHDEVRYLKMCANLPKDKQQS